VELSYLIFLKQGKLFLIREKYVKFLINLFLIHNFKSAKDPQIFIQTALFEYKINCIKMFFLPLEDLLASARVIGAALLGEYNSIIFMWQFRNKFLHNDRSCLS